MQSIIDDKVKFFGQFLTKICKTCRGKLINLIRAYTILLKQNARINICTKYHCIWTVVAKSTERGTRCTK